jgi:hypothetical protein
MLQHIIFLLYIISIKLNRISDVMVSVLNTSGVDRGFASGRVKPDYKIGILVLLR